MVLIVFAHNNLKILEQIHFETLNYDSICFSIWSTTSLTFVMPGKNLNVPSSCEISIDVNVPLTDLMFFRGHEKSYAPVSSLFNSSIYQNSLLIQQTYQGRPLQTDCSQ